VNEHLHPVQFVGGALEEWRALPRSARIRAGIALSQWQRGFPSPQWKRPKLCLPYVFALRIGTGPSRPQLFAVHAGETIGVLFAGDAQPPTAPRLPMLLVRDRYWQLMPPLAGARVPRLVRQSVRQPLRQQATCARIADVLDVLDVDAATIAQLRVRIRLLLVLHPHLRLFGQSQRGIASRLGISAPQLSAIRHGHLERVSIDLLLALVVRAGISYDAVFAAFSRTTPAHTTASAP
jgi:predicted XRE-type DNA-binding protein/phage-related protein